MYGIGHGKIELVASGSVGNRFGLSHGSDCFTVKQIFKKRDCGGWWEN